MYACKGEIMLEFPKTDILKIASGLVSMTVQTLL